MIDKATQYLKLLTGEQNKATMIKYATYAIIVITILSIIFYVRTKINLNDANCSNLNSLYKEFPTLSSINPQETEYQHDLRDYYVKTAYNCCCGGKFKNDYVNTCALKACIKQGARCLDFEIYSVKNKPVIAASSVNDFDIKEMYNSVDFSEAIDIINNNAFSGSTCPNSYDPLILHFRIMSENKEIYNQMADTIYKTLGPKLLGKDYSYQYSGYNLGVIPLEILMGKVIIMIDKTNPLFESTPLAEYCNIATNSIFMRASRDYDIKYTPDMQELIEYNKKHMTLSMPDLGPNDTNVSAALHFKYGVQFVGMCFQNFDSNMEYYDILFDKTGHAFILKPEALRYIPVTIPAPKKQDPALSYSTRPVKTDYYEFNV